MANQNIQETGYRLVIQRLTGFLAGMKQAEAASASFARAQLQTQSVSLSVARTAANAADALAAAQRQLAITTRKTDAEIASSKRQLGIATRQVSADIATRERRLAALREDLAAAGTASDRRRLLLRRRIAQEEIALNAARAAGEERIETRRTAVQTARINRIERIAVAEAAVLAASRRQSEAAAVGQIARSRADISAAVAAGAYSTALGRASAITGVFTAVTRAATAATTAFGRVLIAVTGFSNRFAVSLRFGLAALTAFIGAFALGAVSKFEDTLVRIDNLTNATASDVERLRGAFLNLSKSIPRSPDELGAAAYFVLSSGVNDVNQALAITETAAKASAVGLGTTEEIARVITSVINAYGKENITAAQAADILFAAIREGSAEAEDFAQNIGRLTPIARNLGITFDQLAAGFAGLTNVGLRAEQAATALLGILNQLQSPSVQARKALEDVGTSVEQLRLNVRERGLLPALQEMLQLFGNNVQVLERLFPEVRGLGGVLALLRDNGRDNVRILDNIQNSGNALNTAFERVSKTLSFQAGLLKNALNRALIELGTKVLPDVINAIRGLHFWLVANQEAIINFIHQGIRVALGALSALFKGIGLIIEGFTTLISAMTSVIGKSAATAVAIGSIALGLAWVLPGSPYIKGLLLIVALLGLIKGEAGTRAITPLVPGHADILAQRRDDLRRRQQELVQQIQNERGPSQLGPLGGPGAVANFLGIRTQTQKDLVEINAQLEETETLLTEARKKAKEETDPFKILLEQLEQQFNDLSIEADDLDNELQQLKDDFKASSEAAGQVKSLTDEIKLFGQVSKELAASLGLDALAAGAVQGIDAVIRAREREEAAAFDLARTLGTVATAFEHSADVARRIVLELARSALQASQSALAAVLGRPTREVAGLSLQLAQSQLAGARTAAVVNPQLEALQDRLEAVNKQAEQINKAQEAARKAQEAIKRQAEEARDRLEEQIDVAREQLEQMQLADLEATIAWERINANLEKLIDETRIEAAELQEAFLISNEKLQRQINEAIGRGDATTALRLVDQQRDQAKAYQAQAKELEKTEQNLQRQQKAIQLEEEERRRGVRLAQAYAQAQIQQIEKAREQLEVVEQTNNAFERQTATIQLQQEALQNQIASLNNVNEAQNRQTARIQEQIAIYEAQTAILEAQGVLADKTLLTQAEQRTEAIKLIEQIKIESQAVRDLAKLTNTSLIPEIDEANRQFNALNQALEIVANKGLRQTFLSAIDAAAVRLGILGKTAEINAQAQVNAAGAILTSGQALITGIRNLAVETISRLTGGAFTGGTPNLSVRPRQLGGFTSGTELSLLHPREVVLPLDRPARARELLGSISPATLASILPRGGGQTVFAPNITVTGETLDTMEATAIRAVQKAFRDARGLSVRGGGLITQGIGPSR